VREAITLADERVRWILPPEAAGSGADSGAKESESESGSAAPPPPPLRPRGRPPKRRLRGDASPEPPARAHPRRCLWGGG
jgi:hypothetical protein